MDIVIIGGVAAGSKAAAKVKRLQPNANVKIYTDDSHVSYSSCGIPYYIEGNFDDYRALLVRSVEEFASSGIDVFLNSRVEKILPMQKDILVASENAAELVRYDKLIIATGAKAKIPNIKGITDYQNIYTVRKIEDGINIKNKMLESNNAIIIGSGYIGIELLEAFVKNGLHVSVIESKSKIMGTFDNDISDLIKKRLESSAIGNFEFYTNETVDELITENNLVKKVKLRSGKEIQTDMIVICAGVEPNIELAKDAGIELGITGAIKVNKLMHTSIEDIYACGDCAEKRHIVSGRPVWIPLGSTANKEGRCAAINAAGDYCEFEGVLGSTVTRCLNTTMAKTGLTEEEALEVGFSPISALVLKTDRVAYMPEAGDITLKIVADKVTGLLLGGQAIGAVGADKRINTLTSALLGHLTVEAFNNNDLTYAPPYSTTIDPLLNAMQILTSKMAKLRQN